MLTLKDGARDRAKPKALLAYRFPSPVHQLHGSTSPLLNALFFYRTRKLWLCLRLARPAVVQKGAALAVFGQLAIGELMSYPENTRCRRPTRRSFETFPASDLVRCWNGRWYAIKTAMQTGEIILLVGVIGAIAGATAAGYRRSRRIPEPAGAEPERDAPDLP